MSYFAVLASHISFIYWFKLWGNKKNIFARLESSWKMILTWGRWGSWTPPWRWSTPSPRRCQVSVWVIAQYCTATILWGDELEIELSRACQMYYIITVFCNARCQIDKLYFLRLTNSVCSSLGTGVRALIGKLFL